MHVFACHFVTSQEDYVFDVRYLNLYFRVNVRNFSFRLSFTLLTVSVNCKFFPSVSTVPCALVSDSVVC